MSVLQVFFIVIFVFVCIVLIFLILIQNNKDGGLGMLAGGSSQSTYRSATVDVVTKITWYLLVAFFIIAILAAILFAEGTPQISDKDDEFDRILEPQDLNPSEDLPSAE